MRANGSWIKCVWCGKWNAVTRTHCGHCRSPRPRPSRSPSATNLVNVTGRVSDLRSFGYDVRCEKRFDGEQGYRVVEPDGEQAELGLIA